MSEEEVCAMFGVQPRTLREWRAERGLPFVRISSKVIFYRFRDLDEWLGRHRVAIRA